MAKEINETELTQQLLLLQLITTRLPHLLLPLIKHHLLDHPARLAIQIAQLRALGRDLRDVDLGRRRYHVFPPLHLIHLVQVQLEDLVAGWRSSQRPGGFVDVDFEGEVALCSE